MSEPYFSIVVVCRNAAATISATLESVRMQDEKERELIVIDGRSTDGTGAILAAYGRDITHLESEADSGVYDAMNKGVRLARGQWLLFLGANDCLAAPDVLTNTRAAIGNSQRLLFCGEAAYGDGRVWSAPTRPRVLYRNFMHHQSSFYHRSLFERFRYDESLRIQGDYDLNLQLWRAGIVPTPLPVRVSVCATGGLSDGGRWTNYREEILVRHRHFAAWKALFWDAGSVLRYFRKKAVRSF